MRLQAITRRVDSALLTKFVDQREHQGAVTLSPPISRQAAGRSVDGAQGPDIAGF